MINSQIWDGDRGRIPALDRQRNQGMENYSNMNSFMGMVNSEAPLMPMDSQWPSIF